MSGYSSLRLLLAMTDAFGDVSASALDAAWSRWVGPTRFARRLEQFTKAGWAQPTHGHSMARIIHLTNAGRLSALGGRDPDAQWRRPWDGRWRLVLFDIPEEQLALRAKLRRKLRDLGFGYLQNSVWISPDPADELRKLVAGADIDVESFTVMEARPASGETDQEIVTGAWDFARINHNYAAYVDTLNAAGTGIWNAKAQRSWFDVEGAAWARAIGSDPLLPDVLLPLEYRGREAWQRRRDLLPRIIGNGRRPS